jgi:hypothetical protein
MVFSTSLVPSVMISRPSFSRHDGIASKDFSPRSLPNDFLEWWICCMCTHSEECAKAIGFNNVVSISPLLAEMAFGNNIWYTHHKAWIDNRSITLDPELRLPWEIQLQWLPPLQLQTTSWYWCIPESGEKRNRRHVKSAKPDNGPSVAKIWLCGQVRTHPC